MKIAICDDEKVFIDRLIKLIDEPNITISVFNSGEKLLQSEIKFDIVLLDIEMPGLNGFDIAGELLKRDKQCLLLFITSHSQYSMKGYEFRAFRYVLKSEPDEFIKRNICDAISEYKNNHFYLTISYKGEIAKILSREIIYIEAYGHTIIIHTKQQEYKGKNKFKEIYCALQNYGFLQCHKSYIINMRYIKSIEKSSFINLINNEKIPIGRKYNREVISKYLEFEGRRI